MVAPNSNLENKQFLSSAFTSFTVQMAPLSPVVVMDVNKVDNFNNIRERSPSFSKVSSRSISVFSSVSSILYYKRMVINHNLSDEESKKPVDSS